MADFISSIRTIAISRGIGMVSRYSRRRIYVKMIFYALCVSIFNTVG